MTTDFSIEDNVKYLASGMFYLGFGERHYGELVEKMNANQAEFQISHTATRQQQDAEYKLDFKKAAEGEWMNLTGYRVTMKDDPSKTQYFSVYKNNGITAKEAFSMLQDRPICKTRTHGEIKFETWHKLDMGQKTKNGNFVEKIFNKDQRFSLDRALANLPWSQTEGKGMPVWAADDLKKGNALQGTISVGGQDVEVTLKVDPAKREVQAFDAKGAIIAVGTGLSERELSRQQSEKQGEAAKQEDRLPFEPDNRKAENAGESIANDAGQSVSDKKNNEPQNPVDKSIQNDPVRKMGTGEKAGKEPVTRIPPRIHAPLESGGQSVGKRR